MTEQEAIALASEFVKSRKPRAGQFLEARLLKAERFNRIRGYQRYKTDFWIVDFDKILPPGVLGENPKTVSIVVENADTIYEDFPES